MAVIDEQLRDSLEERLASAAAAVSTAIDALKGLKAAQVDLEAAGVELAGADLFIEADNEAA